MKIRKWNTKSKYKLPISNNIQAKITEKQRFISYLTSSLDFHYFHIAVWEEKRDNNISNIQDLYRPTGDFTGFNSELTFLEKCIIMARLLTIATALLVRYKKSKFIFTLNLQI